MTRLSLLAPPRVRPPWRWLIALGSTLLAGLLGPARAGAGHELPFYPGYYPQEIRLDTVSPAGAAPMLEKSELHAYVGADAFSGRKDPADIRSMDIYPKIERVEKFLRDYRIVREPLGAPGTDEDKLDIPACRYVVVGGYGRVAAAGLSREVEGNRLIVDLTGRLRPGSYTVLLALVLGDNEVNPEIATANYRVEAGP